MAVNNQQDWQLYHFYIGLAELRSQVSKLSISRLNLLRIVQQNKSISEKFNKNASKERIRRQKCQKTRRDFWKYLFTWKEMECYATYLQLSSKIL